VPVGLRCVCVGGVGWGECAAGGCTCERACIMLVALRAVSTFVSMRLLAPCVPSAGVANQGRILSAIACMEILTNAVGSFATGSTYQ
jgi:hypothetical protein